MKGGGWLSTNPVTCGRLHHGRAWYRDQGGAAGEVGVVQPPQLARHNLATPGPERAAEDTTEGGGARVCRDGVRSGKIEEAEEEAGGKSSSNIGILDREVPGPKGGKRQ